MGTCECVPGLVENKHGECVPCIRKYRKYFKGGAGSQRLF